MTLRRAFITALLAMIACTAPLTVVEERDPGVGLPEAGSPEVGEFGAGEFGEAGNLDSGFEEGGAFIGDPTTDGGENG